MLPCRAASQVPGASHCRDGGRGPAGPMTHQAAIALGRRCGCWPSTPRPGPQVSPDVVPDRTPTTTPAPRAADRRHRPRPSTTNTSRPICWTNWSPTASTSPAAVGPGARPGQVDDAHRRWRAPARRCRGSPRSVRWPTSRRSPEAGGGPVVLKTIRGGYDGRGVVITSADSEAEARGRREATWPTGCRSCRGAGAMRRTVGVGRAVGVRAGRGLAGGRKPFSAGICVVEVIAPAPDLSAGLAAEAQQLGLRLAAELAWSVSWPSNCSRPSAASLSSTNWRCARTTRGTGPWTAPSPASSSSICAPCWTIRWATPRPRPGDRDG